MKAVDLDTVIEMSRKSIALQQEQLQTLDKVFVAMKQHLDAQRKRNHLPKLKPEMQEFAHKLDDRMKSKGMPESESARKSWGDSSKE